MTGARAPTPTGPSREPARGGPARAIGQVLPTAMRGLGLPPRALVHRVEEAWKAVADPAWAARTRIVALQHGTLLVGVASAPLRDELARFHAERLLEAMRARLTKDPLVALRFVAAAEEPR